MAAASFLSCLYGSEHQYSAAPLSGTFLSCLYGSEQPDLMRCRRDRFLSCLYGSERLAVAQWFLAAVSKLPVRLYTVRRAIPPF